MIARLFGPEFNVTWGLVAVLVVLAVAWLAAHFAARLIRVLLMTLTGAKDDVSFRAPLVRRPIRTVWFVVFLLVTAVFAGPALELAGAQVERGVRLEMLTTWLVSSGLNVAVILLLGYAVTRLVGTLVGRLELELVHQDGVAGLERAKRAKTLSSLVRSVVNTVVWALAALMVLHELNINIMPVLTGAGIAGLAVGFGAQTLVRDFISGFFLIFEDQVRVGDVANINGTGGFVEAITLRTIVLRDLNGTVHVFPNGAVDKMSNLTKDFSFYAIDLGVAYKEDTDEVVKVLREVSAGLQADPAFGPNILEPLEVLGVDAFDESQVTIKIRLKTVPLKQWEVGREFRRRIKKAFDAAGIEIPFPQVTMHFGQQAAATLSKMRAGA